MRADWGGLANYSVKKERWMREASKEQKYVLIGLSVPCNSQNYPGVHGFIRLMFER